MTLLRSLLFNLFYLLWSAIMHVVSLPLLLAPAAWVWKAAHLWIDGTLFLLRLFCGLGYRELGLEHFPHGPAIIAAKHQSAWETLFLSRRLNHPSFILKRELLSIPLFGWFLRKIGMIAIDRSGRAAALKQMVRDANTAFAQGRQIIIFPEGTRVAPGAHKPYQPGIAALYSQLNVPVVPVALNSGLFWGRKAWTKKPGRILIEYLPAIPPGLDRKSFMAELEARLEPAAKKLLSGAV
ncbi:lysophospholipid acyltransferase family protein [Dongia deserti]|uniref:lysophospholipid acyltransferase family protein n=1 Tax=Dongia deserti TaxID=2268030 RepID=UPI000E64742D|nr:lysophospholipid acyltransferase family protein [Dongia deserti]